MAAHFIGSISGMMLMITGLSITFNQQLGWVIDLLGGSAISMLLHRIFATILILSFSYFGTYIVLDRITSGRRDSNISFSPSFFIRLIRDMIDDILWTFGLRKERPKAGKYDWIMVADIFGMPTLALIEIITGAIMWFPATFLVENPMLFFTFRTIHVGVAIFLVLFVLAHTTILHMAPGNFPVNMSIFSGKISEKKAKIEHEEWVSLAERVEEKEPEVRMSLAGYFAGVVSCAVILLIAITTTLMASEGMAGLRIVESEGIYGVVAAVGLNLAIIILAIYIVVSVVALVKGVSD
jgi:cytochrome b subunit of formate dehydrogenase